MPKNIYAYSQVLYGELRPLDVIKPYRLEMGTKLPTSKGKNLYEFWGNKIQENLLKELKANKSELIVNLASKEYFSVVGSLPKNIEVVAPVFKDLKNGEYKLISFYAKKARGLHEQLDHQEQNHCRKRPSEI